MTDVPNLVRARLAGEAPMEHPDANVLAAFSEQSLPLSEREPVLAHLARCADCREVVALALPVVETQAAPARVFGTAWRMPALRWAAVVTCFLVVGAAVLLRDRSAQTEMHSDADVALPAARVGGTREMPESPATAPLSVFRKGEPGHEADKVARTRKALKDAPSSATSGAEELEAAVAAEQKANKPAGAAQVNALSAPKTTSQFKVDGGTALDSLAAKGARRDENTAVPSPSPTSQDLGASKEEARAPAQLVVAPEKTKTKAANPSETVEVEASTAPATAGNEKSLEFPGRAKAAPSASALAGMQANVSANGASLKKQATAGTLTSAMAAGGAHWTLSAQGQLQRSLDNGKSWEPVPVLESVTFRALSAVGSHVWVGGAKGVLYHSADAGTHWTQVKPVSAGQQMSDDIVELRFADGQRGQLSTTSGEVWTTSDAGQTWHKND